VFSFTHPATTAIYTLSLHDALPIYVVVLERLGLVAGPVEQPLQLAADADVVRGGAGDARQLLQVALDAQLDRLGRDIRLAEQRRSEEHTSELQSRGHLVCRLLLEKK